ncbi:MAG TPA: outer membrane beta-barrel family protein [Flavobacterium sp.]
MKHLFICLKFLLLLSCELLYAQQPGNISGTVIDSNNNNVGFANVAILDHSSGEVVTGTVTDPEGKFSIVNPGSGTYRIRIQSDGTVQMETAAFVIASESESKDMGTIVVKANANQLAEVQIESLRPQITHDGEKMVVQVEGTAMAAGNTALTVLSRMPGVFVDPEGNIRLNGKAGVTVMLDGKLTYLSAADLRNMLESMPADNLKNVEIITNPSSKYDAEGTSGILNINLKKNLRRGTNGSLFTGTTYNFKQIGYNYGGNINYRAGKWSSFFHIDNARRVGGRDATFTRVFYGEEFATYFDQTATASNVNTGPPTVRLGADYAIDDKNEIGFVTRYSQNTGRSDFLTDTYIAEDQQNPYQYIRAENYSQNKFSSFNANLHYIRKIDTLGTVLTSDLDLVKIANRGESHFNNYFTNLELQDQTQDFLYSSTPSDFDIYSGKIDFTRPFASNNKIEAGVKASRVSSDNDSKFYFDNGPRVLDPLRTNRFLYSENIFAAYGTWSAPISKKLSVKVGLRAENTVSDGKSLTTGEHNKRNYIDVFPSAFVTQKVSDKYEISYSYSRRITRPNYGNLNPFRSYRDPYTWTQGNPNLRPQYTHYFSIVQSINKTYFFTLSYNYDKDVMAEIPILDVENATTTYTTGNVDDGQSVDFTAVVPQKVTNWWDSQNVLSVNYRELEMKSENVDLANSKLSYNIQSNHTMKLPENIRLELNFRYQTPAASGLYQMAAMSRIDIAVKRAFFNKKLEVVVNANDVYKGWRFRWATDINGNVNDFDQYFRIRSIGLSLRYNFNSGEKVKEAKTPNVEELNRL